MVIETSAEHIDSLKDVHDPKWGGQMLQRISIFSEFTLDELEEMYQIGHLEKVKSSTFTVIEGEPTRGLYIIIEGKMSVYKNNPSNGKMARIAYIEAGQWFGEYSLFDDTPRSATIMAEIPCLLFNLDEATFNQFLENKGDNLKMRFYETCAKDLVAKFRIQNAEYINAQNLLWQYALRRSTSEATDAKPSVKDNVVEEVDTPTTYQQPIFSQSSEPSLSNNPIQSVESPQYDESAIDAANEEANASFVVGAESSLHNVSPEISELENDNSLPFFATNNTESVSIENEGESHNDFSSDSSDQIQIAEMETATEDFGQHLNLETQIEPAVNEDSPKIDIASSEGITRIDNIPFLTENDQFTVQKSQDNVEEEEEETSSDNSPLFGDDKQAS